MSRCYCRVVLSILVIVFAWLTFSWAKSYWLSSVSYWRFRHYLELVVALLKAKRKQHQNPRWPNNYRIFAIGQYSSQPGTLLRCTTTVKTVLPVSNNPGVYQISCSCWNTLKVTSIIFIKTQQKIQLKSCRGIRSGNKMRTFINHEINTLLGILIPL